MLIFDLEAGGLSGHRSSILSLSFGRRGAPVHSLFASPVQGLWMSRWSEKHVWKPIQRMTRGQGRSEGSILTEFLSVLESQPKGSTLAGWNIGYQIAPQDIEGRAKGFDIPMLLTRAKAYGLEERYSSALSNLKIRDIGQEYAWKIAKEAVKRPELIEKDLFAQIQSFVKAGGIYQAQTGASEESVARHLATSGFRMAGWKQELVHGVLFPGIEQRAHESAFDVAAAMRLATREGPIFKSSEELSKWASGALRNKLISSRTSTADLLAIARAPISAAGTPLPSIESEYLSEVAKGVIGKEEGAVFGRGGAMKIAREIVSAHKVPLAIGGGLLAVLTGARYFSGKDDDWNTIEGLPHGGMSEGMRHSMTDFGSGWVRNLISKAFGRSGILGRGEFAISRAELRSMTMNYTQIVKRLGMTGRKAKGIVSLGKTGTQILPKKVSVDVALSPEELRKLSVSDIFEKLGIKRQEEIVTGVGTASFPGMQEDGLAAILRKKNTDFGSPVDLLKAANRAAGLYKKNINKILKTKGLSASSWVHEIEEGAEGVGMHLMAKSKEGTLLAGVSRLFGHGAVDLTQIEVGQGLSGIGKQIYEREAGILRKVGYEAGEKITSPVSSPITARWQMQMYGSKIQNATGVNPNDFSSLEQAIVDKKMTKEAFPGMTLEGTIPEGPSLWQKLGLGKRQDAEMVADRLNLERQSRAAKMQTGHRMAQVSSSSNALRPGIRHRQKAGKIVQ